MHVSRIPFPLAILLIVFLGSSVATAQEWDAVTLELSLDISDLCMLSDGQHGWAVGQASGGGETFSGFLHTTDGGATWEPGTIVEAKHIAFNSVFFVSPSVGWIVGSSGLILATTDGGGAWTLKNSGTGRRLNSVCFLNEEEGWITGGQQDGSSYLVLHTRDGGAHWTDQSFGSTCYSCEDIIFTDNQNGWICGYNSALDGHIHHTSDGGTTWAEQTVPRDLGQISSIDFANPDVGWATTSSLYASPAGAVLHTTNGGADWSIAFYTNYPYNYCLDVQDEMRAALAAFTLFGNYEERIWTTDDGEVWTAHASPVASYTYAIQRHDENIWFGTQYSQILRSTNGAATWSWTHHAPLWNSISWSDPATAWIVAGSHVHSDGYCHRSCDGGATWEQVPEAPGGMEVHFHDSNAGWMLWGGDGASLWRTVDGGAVWTEHDIGAGSWIEGICFASADTGWAYGGGGTVRATRDGGIHWTPQNLGTTLYVQGMVFVTPRIGWAFGGYGSGNGFIRFTTDAGATWSEQTPAVSNHNTAGSFPDKQHGWLGTVGGYIQHTTDGGAQWEYCGQVPHTYIDAITMVDETCGWLSARNHYGGHYPEDGRGFIYRTDDGGASWSLFWSSPWPRGAVSDLTLAPDGTAWACGRHDARLRYRDFAALAESGNTGIHLAIAANPGPGPFAIEFAVPGGGPVAVDIWDLTGRLIHSLGRGGAQHLFWDGRDRRGIRQPSGIYLARLTVGQRSEVRRICLTR